MHKEGNGSSQMGSTIQDGLRKPLQSLVRRATLQAEIYIWERSFKIRGYNVTH
jgi:hypothetical protein